MFLHKHVFADQVEVVGLIYKNKLAIIGRESNFVLIHPFPCGKEKKAFSRRRNLRYGRNLAFSRRRDVRFCKKVALYKSRNIRYGKKEVFLGDAISDVGSDHSVATKQIW